MGRRSGWGGFVGALLPLPLILVWVAAQREVHPARAQASVSPVLSHEERMQRTTYLRHCEKSSDCESPLQCLRRWDIAICTDSECMTDVQCREDEACQEFETDDHGPRVRACITQGRKREGERCKSLPSNRAEACEPGLRCFEGWCGRPCRRDVPMRCPQGFFCAEDAAVCLPTCEGGTCPEGQQCVRLNNRQGDQNGSTCVVVHGDNCQQSACPEGLLCQVFDVPRRPGEAWMGCRQRCGEGRPACAQGLLCRYGYCRQPCDPQASGGCGSGEKCDRYAPEEPWVCQPDW